MFGNFGVGGFSQGGGFLSNLRDTIARGYQQRQPYSLNALNYLLPPQHALQPIQATMQPYAPKPQPGGIGYEQGPQPLPRFTMPRGYGYDKADNPMAQNFFVRPMTPRAEARTRVGYGKMPIARARSVR